MKAFNTPRRPRIPMGFMRRDYISERRMIVAGREARTTDPKKSPYAPGNEAMTRPAVLALVSKDGMLQRLQDSEDEHVRGWAVRVFESADPIVTTDTENTYGEFPHHREPAYGHHYIVIASPDHRETLATISVDQWTNVLIAVQDRMRWLYTQKGVTYVAIYASHSGGAEAQNDYPRLDIATFSTIPPVIEKESATSHRIFNESGACALCHTIEIESAGPRQVLQTEGYFSFCPWAPAHEYEYWICPKKHTTSFTKITNKEISDLALMLRATLGGLCETVKGASFGIAFHLSPEKKNSKQIHWHVEVYPVSGRVTGLEHGYGIHLNATSPEAAASSLGESSRREIARLVGIV